jgi:hypothetical protein
MFLAKGPYRVAVKGPHYTSHGKTDSFSVVVSYPTALL